MIAKNTQKFRNAWFVLSENVFRHLKVVLDINQALSPWLYHITILSSSWTAKCEILFLLNFRLLSLLTEANQ